MRLLSMKLKYNRKRHKSQRDRPIGGFVYPLFVIIFIFATLYFFILGDNGFYSHKSKFQSITLLEEGNHKLKGKIFDLQVKNNGLKTLNPQDVEREARRIPLKKRGDVIIRLYYSNWISELGEKYKSQYHKGFKPPPIQLSFIDQYKMLIAVTVSLLIALLVTLLLPWFRRKSSEGQKEEIG